MADDRSAAPLSPLEEATWRALIRFVTLLPRTLDQEMSRDGGLSMSRYIVLMRLSEAPDRSLRMTDLAEASTLSPSRMTRIIQPMITEGLVVSGPAPDDGRTNLVQLTDQGLQRLQKTWPAHLSGVRDLVLDHIAPADLPGFHRVVQRLLDVVSEAAAANRPMRGPGNQSHQ